MKNYVHGFLFGTNLNQDKILNIGWLLFRLHIGLSIAIHAGWPKINGSSTPDWFIKQVGELGFMLPSPAFWAAAATWGEFAGGLMLAAGILTRFAALQLAFQFFVISFLWYEKPEFLTGMYFQQLFMWCFVLATFVGGGRYSLDTLVRRAALSKVQQKLKPAIAIFLMLCSLESVAQMKPLNGNGKIIHKSYAFVDFDKVNLQDLDGELKIEVGKPFAITTDCDENLAPLLAVSVAGGTLEIKIINNDNNRRYIENSGISIRIFMPEISQLQHTGNSNLRLLGVTGRLLRVTNTGNGDAEISGSTGEFELIKNGNGDTDASQLAANKVKVEAYGNGDVKVQAVASLVATSSGNGDVINVGPGKLLEGSGSTGNGKIKMQTTKN